jgi:hypothetical protein
VWSNYHDAKCGEKGDMLPAREQVAALPDIFRALSRQARALGVRTNIPHVAPWMRQYFEHCLDGSGLWMRRCLNDFSCLEIAAKLFVDADGSVLPCALLPPAGNVREAGLAELVERMRPVRQAIRDGKFTAACNRCSCQMSINYKFSVLRSPARNFGHLCRYGASLVREKLLRML